MSNKDSEPDMKLFWGCFIALIATAFGFIVRAQVIGEWGAEFNLSKSQQGEIFGVGLWPFAISIVIFSLIIDKIGYKVAMIFGFVCHVVSFIMTYTATGYDSLYWATFIVALGNGTVEAYINPVAATMFKKDKTKWLNILHAGWPGGLVLGGLIAWGMGDASWQTKVGLILIPTVVYIFMLMPCKFPENERVAAGVTYKDMLKEIGALGALIISALIVWELGRAGVVSAEGWSDNLKYAIVGVITVGSFLYLRSLGRPLFVFLLLIMIPLATTELGTDSWITPLMESVMENGALVLIYTSAIMAILRFYAGPIVHKLSPLGLLAASSAIACIGLIALSAANGPAMIFAAATLYAFGKTFFWPTMLGVVSEQFPKGGALSLNAMGGVGMLGVGVVGAQFMGLFQDQTVEQNLLASQPAIHAKVVDEKEGVFGAYKAVSPDKAAKLSEEETTALTEIENSAPQATLKTTAIFPAIMLVCYLLIIMYFRKKGGYKPVEI
jgi:MFS family permease